MHVFMLNLIVVGYHKESTFLKQDRLVGAYSPTEML
jgi:hypothetical protein